MSRTILLIGAADTGRAPIAAAILRQMLARSMPDYCIASAGVVGHDGDQAEPEARNALLSMGLDISDHRARSLTDELLATATLLICVDSGIARVVCARYPQSTAQITVLGELSGRQRDLPDPFRMQIGAWIGYAREIEAMLRAGMHRLTALLQGTPLDPPVQPGRTHASASSVETTTHSAASAYASASSTGSVYTAAESTTSSAQPAPTRQAAIARCEQLLALLLTMPHVIAWEAARHQLGIELHTIQQAPYNATELIQPYVTMLLTLLNTGSSMPHSGQINLLRLIITRLNDFIDAQAIATLSNQMIHWGTITS